MSLEALRKSAREGDATAQLRLGVALMTAEGAPEQDVEQGREWLARAANNGSRDAQRFLGMIYLRGMDVVPDYEQGTAYLRQAASQGDADSAWWLASFLGGSRDSWHDAGEAATLLRSAAEAGHARAAAHLGYALLIGALGESDAERALRWFIRAAHGRDPGAMLALAECCEAGFLLPRSPGRAAWLAGQAEELGWEVAGEYAGQLGHAGAPDATAYSIPAEDEIRAVHDGGLPVPRLDVRSWSPRVILVHDLLTTFECAEIVNGALEHVMPSFIVDAEGRLGSHQIRTSHEVRLRPGIRNLVINEVERRMAEWSHFPVENGEFPLLLRYEKAQSFEQHFDYFIPEKFVMGEGPLELGGQRIATQLVYLNEDYSGGETRFDRANLVVRGRRGMGMLFHNVTPAHNVDPLTRHTGVAIESGVKWLLSRWIREIPSDQPARDLQRDRYREA